MQKSVVQIAALGTIQLNSRSGSDQNAPVHQGMSLSSNMMRETTERRTITLSNAPYYE
jgi:hypothetical protein